MGWSPWRRKGRQTRPNGNYPLGSELITATASTMGVDVGHKKMRAVGGGRSPRHAERHEAAGSRPSASAPASFFCIHIHWCVGDACIAAAGNSISPRIVKFVGNRKVAKYIGNINKYQMSE